MRNSTEKAQICFKDLCAMVYGRNAELINSIAVIASTVIVVLTISKTIKNL